MPVTPPTYASTSDLAHYVRAAWLQDVASGDQQAALNAACALAAGYMRSRFKMPLTSWGVELVRHVCNVAAYDLITQRGYNPDAGANVNWRLRYEDAIQWFRDVAGNKVMPDGMTGAAAATDPNTAQLTGQATTTRDGCTLVDVPQSRGWN